MALAPPIAGDGVAAATAAAAGGGGEPLRGDWKARPGRPGLVAVGGAGASDRGVMAPKSSSRGEAAAPTATSAGCSAGEPARAVAALASGVPKSLKSKRLPSKLVCAGGTGGAGGAGELLEAAEGWTILASVQPADEGRTLGDMIRRAGSGGTDSGGGGGGDSGDGPLRGAETCALPRGASRLEAPQAVRVGSTRFELFEIAV
uniref:Uncharacterized protein n=1 Tax=Emiliania huxleyi TaxID=2903 RepID=A0A7S3TSB8_EMIHU